MAANLEKTIISYRKKGFSDDKIREFLINNGFTPEEIEYGFEDIESIEITPNNLESDKFELITPNQNDDLPSRTIYRLVFSRDKMLHASLFTVSLIIYILNIVLIKKTLNFYDELAIIFSLTGIILFFIEKIRESPLPWIEEPVHSPYITIYKRFEAATSAKSN